MDGGGVSQARWPGPDKAIDVMMQCAAVMLSRENVNIPM